MNETYRPFYDYWASEEPRYSGLSTPKSKAPIFTKPSRPEKNRRGQLRKGFGTPRR